PMRTPPDPSCGEVAGPHLGVARRARLAPRVSPLRPAPALLLADQRARTTAGLGGAHLVIPDASPPRTRRSPAAVCVGAGQATRGSRRAPPHPSAGARTRLSLCPYLTPIPRFASSHPIVSMAANRGGRSYSRVVY